MATLDWNARTLLPATAQDITVTRINATTLQLHDGLRSRTMRRRDKDSADRMQEALKFGSMRLAAWDVLCCPPNAEARQECAEAFRLAVVETGGTR